jgi:hypothetical protein
MSLRRRSDAKPKPSAFGRLFRYVWRTERDFVTEWSPMSRTFHPNPSTSSLPQGTFADVQTDTIQYSAKREFPDGPL